MGLSTSSTVLVGASFALLVGAAVALSYSGQGYVESPNRNTQTRPLVLDPTRPGDPKAVTEAPPVFHEPEVYDEYVIIAETPMDVAWQPVAPPAAPSPVQFFGYPEVSTPTGNWEPVTEAVTWLAFALNGAGTYGDADADGPSQLLGRTAMATLAMKLCDGKRGELDFTTELTRAETWLAAQFDADGRLLLKDEPYLPLYQLIATAALQSPLSDDAKVAAPRALKQARALKVVGGWPARTGGEADTFATAMVLALPQYADVYNRARLGEEITRWLLTLDETQPRPDPWGLKIDDDFVRYLRATLLEWAADRYWISHEQRQRILSSCDRMPSSLDNGGDLLCWWLVGQFEDDLGLEMPIPDTPWFAAIHGELRASQAKSDERGSWNAAPFGLAGGTALGAMTMLQIEHNAVSRQAQEAKRSRKDSDKDNVGDSKDAAEAAPQTIAHQPGQGALLWRDGTEAFPLEHTDVRANISGLVGMTHVTQTFANHYDTPIEAVYCFPLPHRAGVTDFLLVVGERRIRAMLRERQEAEDLYSRAVRLGRTAAIVTREHDGVFNHYVGNIKPGAKVNVELTFFEQIKYEQGRFEWVFPMVVGPYFIGGAPVTGIDNDRVVGHGVEPDTTEVPDASRITPPTLPAGTRSGHDIAVAVELEAGFPLASMEVVTHDCVVDELTASARRVTLSSGDAIPNRDFVMRWTVDTSMQQAVVLTHRPDANQPGWFCVMYAPDFTPEAREAREITIIMDTSGSMSRTPIDISRRVVAATLDQLSTQDRFSIIEFNSNSKEVYGPAMAGANEVEQAKRAVAPLRGNGGTHLRAGIQHALALDHDVQRQQLYCILTDGYVGNVGDVVQDVRDQDAEFLTFGIGAAVNRQLIDNIAEATSGRAVYVMPRDEQAVTDAIAAFTDFLQHEHLGHLSIDWGTLDVSEIAPGGVPQIRSGQMVALYGRYSTPGRSNVELRRQGTGGQEAATINLELPESAPGNEAIRHLWAAMRIRDLEQNPPAEPEELKTHIAAIKDLAVSSRLLTRWTAFVAIEERGQATAVEPTTIVQPVELPEGVSRKGVGR